MNGPDHYREAEGLLSHIGEEDGVDAVAAVAAEAQAHATLALTAATVDAATQATASSAIAHDIELDRATRDLAARRMKAWVGVLS